MKSENNFFLPAGYLSNYSIETIDRGKKVYWDSQRVNLSKTYQFSVYKWAAILIESNGLMSVADVGCGYASKLAWLNKKIPTIKYVGIDQENAVSLCREAYDFGDWIGLNFENKPKPLKTKVDLVICSDVIEHLSNPDLLLKYIRSISHQNTLILLSTPERDLLRGEGSLQSPNKFHVREWNKEELAKYLVSQDFEIMKHRILPAMSASFSMYFLRKFARRLMQGRNMNYNQAVLLKLKSA